MYCLKCGSANDNGAWFCKVCGADLSGTSLFDPSRAPKQMSTHRLDFSEAVYQAIEKYGMGLFSNPKHLLAVVSDLCDHGSNEFRLFEYVCDPVFLGAFADLGRCRIDERSLDDAAQRAHYSLCEHSVEPQASQRLCQCLRNVVARSNGLPEKQLTMTISAQGNVPLTHVTRHEDEDRTPSGAYVQGMGPTSGGTTQTRRVEVTKPAVPTPPTYTVPSTSRKGPSIGLVAMLVVLILAIGGVSYNLVAGAQTGGTSVTQDKTVTVSFSGGKGATGKMKNAKVGKGDTYTIPSCDFTRSGYEFRCWTSDNGKDYGPGNQVAAKKDMNFTAKWKKKKTESKASETPEADETPQTNDSPEPTVTPKTYVAPQPVQATPKTATVRYVAGNDEAYGSMEITNVPVGSTFTLPTCGFTLDGYEFAGWVASNGNSYSPGAKATVNGDTTFTAVWTIIQSAPPQSTPTNNNAQKAAAFSRYWGGTYSGRDDNGNVVLRQLLFQFDEVSETGDLKGICYVGVCEADPSATSFNHGIEGHIDWNTGEIYIRHTYWIEGGGGQHPEREYRGAVNSEGNRMAGYLSTLGADNFDIPWEVLPTDAIHWNR